MIPTLLNSVRYPMNTQTCFRRHLKNYFLAGFVSLLPICSLSSPDEVLAQGIESLLLEQVPVPVQRPARPEKPDLIPANFPLAYAPESGAAPMPVAAGSGLNVDAIKGSFRDGIKALADRNAIKALAIRNGMAKTSIEYKTLGWTIALSGDGGLRSADIAEIAGELPGWPGQTTMRQLSEAALARERHSSSEVILAFSNQRPESIWGAQLLARAYLDIGNPKAARAVLAPFWHSENLSHSAEKQILQMFASVLTREDHRIRMHQQFYRERSKAGMRMGALAEQYSLAKARTAVIGNAGNADTLIKAVEPSSQQDVGYLYTRIKRLRRLGKYKDAARLMLDAPGDPQILINPDEWWVERKIISRALLDSGDFKTAYKIAANHSAQSPVDIAEAEFHAGWYALRFLNDRTNAQRHFETIAQITTTPISQARAYYWLGRASTGEEARRHFRSAARHYGTFYGQLAAQRLGMQKLEVKKPVPSPSDRLNFANRDMARAIRLLEATGQDSRAAMLYRALAESLNSAGELAILAARAEKQDKHNLALQIGKIGHSRGLEVETVSWPVGAIPAKAKITGAGRALAYAVARQESAFNAAAISPARARGLLQLMPATAKQMAQKLGVAYSPGKLTSDPAYNASLGAAYLSEQLDNFSNSYILTFVGYNAGPSRARRWIEAYGDPRGQPIDVVVDWIERIPFTETRNYVQRVMENYQIYKARLYAGRFDIEGDLRMGRQ
jgi:soluble lytic murein transglycosylase